jgi:hypothetical protein
VLLDKHIINWGSWQTYQRSRWKDTLTSTGPAIHHGAAGRLVNGGQEKSHRRWLGRVTQPALVMLGDYLELERGLMSAL